MKSENNLKNIKFVSMIGGRALSVWSLIIIIFASALAFNREGGRSFVRFKETPAETAGISDAALTMFRGDASHSGAFKTKELESFGGIEWQFKTNGAVRSSPIIANGSLFIGSSDGVFYAFNLTGGDVKWKFDAKSPIVSTPAVVSGTVYFGTRDGNFTALDAADGKVVWTVKTGADAPLAWGYESGDFFTSSPVVVENQIYWGSGDGFLYAFDRKNGKQLWKFKTGGRIRSTAAVSGGTVYTGSFDGIMYALDRKSGKLKWSYETEGAKLNSGDFGYDRRSIQSSPAIWNNTVVFGARDGFLYAVDAQNGQLRWRYDHKISWVNSSPAVADGKAYAASSDGHFVNCVDIETGRELWRFKSDSLFWSSPALTERFLYIGDWTGNLYALDRTNGTEVWRFQTGKRILSSPVPYEGRIYFGDDGGEVFALNSGGKVPLKRAVFWDAEFAKGAAATSAAHEKIRNFFRSNGYEVLDASKLKEFLNGRISDRQPSVIVFAIDYLPKDFGLDEAGSSPLKKYLNAGGKVVWLGLPPRMWEKNLQTGEFTSFVINREMPKKLLDVGFQRGNFDNNSAAVTAAGKKWGLNGWWLSSWSADTETVTTVLANDETGSAAAWVKNYGGPEGTGFVCIPIVESDGATLTNLFNIKLAAEYFPKRE